MKDIDYKKQNPEDEYNKLKDYFKGKDGRKDQL